MAIHSALALDDGKVSLWAFKLLLCRLVNGLERWELPSHHCICNYGAEVLENYSLSHVEHSPWRLCSWMPVSWFKALDSLLFEGAFVFRLFGPCQSEMAKMRWGRSYWRTCIWHHMLAFHDSTVSIVRLTPGMCLPIWYSPWVKQSKNIN